MQGIISDGIAIVIACLLVAAVASAIIVLRPRKGRRRHRKRHSPRPKIDLFEAEPAKPAAKPDA
ncbi:MAG TPA: hypothetical protein VF620_07760 [Allosphingosinicella sp.]|jgi:hypothetical protein